MREKKENNYGIRGIRGRNETAKGHMTTTNHADHANPEKDYNYGRHEMHRK
jgi:hypothetical protein